MKNRLLKASALILLCIMICLSGTISVFADWVELKPTESTQGKININVKLDTTDEIPTGMRATAFRIIKVNVIDVNKSTSSNPFYQPADPVYKWAPGVADWVYANYKDYIDRTNEDAVTQAYVDLQKDENSDDRVKFIDDLARAIKTVATGITFQKDPDGHFSESSDPLVASASIREDGTATIQGLSKGSFVVLIENGNRIYKPAVANLTPVWRNEQADGTEAGWYVNSPVNLEIKAAGVTIQKTVSDRAAGPFGPAASTGIEDLAYFKIDAVVPEYLDKAVSKTFVIRDEFSTGLTFDNSTKPVVVGVTGEDENEQTQPLIETTDYTFTTEAGSGTVSGKFTITFNDYSKVSSYDKVRVTYNALVNEKAVTGSAGNPNTAYLDYANNPYMNNNKVTIDSRATVYTYGLDLTKTNETGDSFLPGAVFTIEREKDNKWEEIRFVSDNEEGAYHRVTSGGSAKVTTGAEPNLGKLDLRGLDIGKYRLKEVQAPAGGYVVLKNYINFTITDSKLANGDKGINGIPEDATTELDSSATNGYVALSVPNSMGFDLPLTGGMGTILFTVGGAILVAGAVVLLLVANRKKSRRGETDNV